MEVKRKKKETKRKKEQIKKNRIYRSLEVIYLYFILIIYFCFIITIISNSSIIFTFLFLSFNFITFQSRKSKKIEKIGVTESVSDK